MSTDSPTVLYVGIERNVVALDAATGAKRWSTPLPGAFFFTGFVTVHVHGPHVYAAAAGEITCLDAATGAVRWHNTLEGYGVGFATLATGAGADVGSGAPSSNEATAAAASFTAGATAAAGAGGIAAAL